MNLKEKDKIDKADKVWEVAEPVMRDWQERLTLFEERHRVQIKRILGDISNFFGVPTPECINVDIHYMDQVNSSKGEPVSGLVSTLALPQGDSDVFYWLGRVTRLPNDGQQEIEEEERRQTTKIIHEEIHEKLQGENQIFKSVLEEANNDSQVVEMRNNLMKNQLGYLEPEAELTAIYLEHYANSLLQQDDGEGVNTMNSVIDYRVDKDRFRQISGAVLKENDSEKWRNGGPYARLVAGWRKYYDEEETVRADPAGKPAPVEKGDLSIYELGEKITDFSLIESYIAENRKLDLAFVKSLYKIFLQVRE